MHTRLSLAIDEIRTARSYTRNLLQGTPHDKWFVMPPAGASHIAWQVGHLAIAQYRLLLERIRGRRKSDEALISTDFLKTFGAGSKPASADQCPTVDAIMSVFDAVHEQAMCELPALSDASLDEAPTKPHPLFAIKHGSLTWCVRHEMVHAGQIGLLRHQLGCAPQW